MRSRSSQGPSILVTGGAGLIGARVVHKLCARGVRVVVADDLSSGSVRRLDGLLRDERGCARLHPIDVSAAGALSALMGEEGPFDQVLHLAARVGVRRVLADPEGCRREHVAASMELARAVSHVDPGRRPRVIAASTSEVYREACGPLAEDAPLRELDAGGRWAYAASKLYAERILEQAARQDRWRMSPLHLRLFNVVGPDQDAQGGMVLPNFARRAVRGSRLVIHGDGTQVRTFAHVDDVAADLVALMLDLQPLGGPLNLGGDTRCTILDLARSVARAAGRDGDCLRFVDPREFLSSQFEEVQSRVPDLSRARSLGLARGRRSLEEIVAGAVAHARPGCERVLRGGA